MIIKGGQNYSLLLLQSVGAEEVASDMAATISNIYPWVGQSVSKSTEIPSLDSF